MTVEGVGATDTSLLTVEGVGATDASVVVVCWTSLVIMMVVTAPLSGQNVLKLMECTNAHISF